MYLEDFREQATKVVERLLEELKNIRTGAAKPAMIEGVIIEVQAYGGAKMKLKELASISAPDANLLVVQPYDPSVIKDVERSLMVANLGFSPAVDQQTIRLVLPQLTQERREQLAKQVGQKVEDAKVALRQKRTDSKEDIEGQKGEAGISEDDIEREREQLQKMTDEFMQKIELIGKDKEKELKEI